MAYRSDQDGKSKTASAVDSKHYPEQHEALTTQTPTDEEPTHEQIAARAHELWCARGCPEGSADQDWLEAEEQLRAAANSRNVRNTSAFQSGSVQR